MELLYLSEYRAHVSSFERVSDPSLHVPHKKLPVMHKLSVLLKLLFTRTFLNLSVYRQNTRLKHSSKIVAPYPTSVKTDVNFG